MPAVMEGLTAKGSNNLVSGTFGAIGTNGAPEWRQWNVHSASGYSVSGVNDDPH